MKKFTLGLLAIAALAIAVPAIAGNTTLFSSTLGDVTFPLSPPTSGGSVAGRLDNTAIGVTTPAAGHFTTISGTGTISGPVSATTLAASGAVTGAGFTARFAAPGPIGSVTPSTGAFTTLAGTAITGTSLTFTGTAPAPTGTGSPTIAAGSTDTAGEVTAGSSATSVVITFAVAKSNAPFCTVTTQTGGIASFAYAISTTAITVTQSATSGNKINYNCVQH